MHSHANTLTYRLSGKMLYFYQTTGTLSGCIAQCCCAALGLIRCTLSTGVISVLTLLSLTSINGHKQQVGTEKFIATTKNITLLYQEKADVHTG